MLLAFDSFKGSLTATEACSASAELLEARFGDRVRVVSIPLADGGEGSLELLRRGRKLVARSVPAVDAIGRPCVAEYLYSEDERVAYIEVAKVIGLPEVSDVELRPLQASSFGAGLLVADALAQGAERLVVFLGGSATTDGGAGMWSALGARLLDRDGVELQLGGGALATLAAVDIAEVAPSALAAEWVFVADVNAPLLGPTGAAQSYSPQKGADAVQVVVLEEALDHASVVLEERTGRELRTASGAGAAGGMQLFISAFCATEMLAGGPFLAAETGAIAALVDADVVVTGEGRFDAQSLDGKVVGTLAMAAAQLPTPPAIVVVAGDVREARTLRKSGKLGDIDAVFGIADSAAELAELQSQAATLVAECVAEAISLTLAARG